MTFDPWKVAQSQRSPGHLGGIGLVVACALDSFFSWRVWLVVLLPWRTCFYSQMPGHYTLCHCVHIVLCVALVEAGAG